jgi:hypothetical protein
MLRRREQDRLDDQARKVAMALGAERATDLIGLVGRLTFLQIDPTAAIAPVPIWSAGVVSGPDISQNNCSRRSNRIGCSMSSARW